MENRLNNMEEVQGLDSDQFIEAIKEVQGDCEGLIHMDEVSLHQEATTLTIEKQYLRAVIKQQKEIINQLKKQIRA